MPLVSSSRAAAVGASVVNKQFGSTASVLSRKTLIVGTYDPAKTTITDEVPMLVTSAEYAGDTFGFGYMLHRLVQKSMLASNSGETWVQPQSEAGGAVTAAGTLTFAGTATGAGTINLYVAGEKITTAVAVGDTPAVIAAAVIVSINAVTDTPIIAVVDGATPEEIDITSKSKGPWGNDISLTFNWGFQEVFPTTVTCAVVDMAAGATNPSMADALDGLGTGADANEDHYTDLVHGYGQDTTVLDVMSSYNGAGNEALGLWAKTVARPFRSILGDVDAGAAGLAALIVVADLRKTDRTSGVIAVPGSPNHPSELAALAMGVMARLNNNRAEQSPINQILSGVIPGAVADRWTSSYASIDTAVKGGISPTKIAGGAVYMLNTLTFFRPASVPATSNGYASQRNISILQNILYNAKLNFEQSKWDGISIVDSVAKVANITDRQKARDIEAVKDDLIALANSFRDNAWVFEVDAYTIPNITVAIRGGGSGFDSVLPIILSGEGGIIDTVIEFDTAITVLL